MGYHATNGPSLELLRWAQAQAVLEQAANWQN